MKHNATRCPVLLALALCRAFDDGAFTISSVQGLLCFTGS